MKQRIVIIFLVIFQVFITFASADASPLYVLGKGGAGDFDNDYLKKTNGTLEIQEQIQSYIQHEMTLDQFAKEANRTINMILLEEGIR